MPNHSFPTKSPTIEAVNQMQQQPCLEYRRAPLTKWKVMEKDTRGLRRSTFTRSDLRPCINLYVARCIPLGAGARAFARVYSGCDLRRHQRSHHEKQGILREIDGVRDGGRGVRGREAEGGNPRGISSAACKSPLCSGRGVSVVHRRICISMAYAINRCSRPQRSPATPSPLAYQNAHGSVASRRFAFVSAKEISFAGLADFV